MSRSKLTTLCYIEDQGRYLMLHRVSKKNDVNKDKWIGVGGHFEEGESPEECLLREVKEETGLTLTSFCFRGLVTFQSAGWGTEYMCLYTSDGYEGELTGCSEGVLEWVDKDRVLDLNLWEGDKIFFKLMNEGRPFFSLKLSYEGDRLAYAGLDGKQMELLEVLGEDGAPTGAVRERSLVHRDGDLHGTSHVWVARKGERGRWEVLLQKRGSQKDSYPGCWDISAAGHVQAGDDYLDSALRELFEELGIQAEAGELGFAGWHRRSSQEVFGGRPFKNREISAVYVYREPVGELSCQETEVEEVRWMELSQCMEAAQNGSFPNCLCAEELELVEAYLKK